MPAPGVTLSDAIEEFIRHRKANDYADNTVKANTRSLNMLLVEVGNIQVRHFSSVHGDRFRAYLTGKGYKPNSVNLHLDAVSVFIKWAHTRGYLPRGSNPMVNVRRHKPDPDPRQIVEPEDFHRLLDAAHLIETDAFGRPVLSEHGGQTITVHGNAHDRIIVALGLFLFLRQGEIRTLTVGGVNLDRGEMRVRSHKGKMWDVMPIDRYLAAELRRWLTWYAIDVAIEHGSMQPGWLLVPRRKAPILRQHYGTGRGGQVVQRPLGNTIPTLPTAAPHRNVQRTLERFGVPIRDDDGKSLLEGVHTLRRSGARALFNHLTEQKGYDGALRQVASMLHHKSTATTERYLQISVDVKMRNDLIRGEDMFGLDRYRTVTPIRRADSI